MKLPGLMLVVASAISGCGVDVADQEGRAVDSVVPHDATYQEALDGLRRIGYSCTFSSGSYEIALGVTHSAGKFANCLKVPVRKESGCHTQFRVILVQRYGELGDRHFVATTRC